MLMRRLMMRRMVEGGEGLWVERSGRHFPSWNGNQIGGGDVCSDDDNGDDVGDVKNGKDGDVDLDDDHDDGDDRDDNDAQ